MTIASGPSLPLSASGAFHVHVQTAGDPCELLAALMDVLDHAAYHAVQPRILATLLDPNGPASPPPAGAAAGALPRIRELFKNAEFRQLFRARLPPLEPPRQGHEGRYTQVRTDMCHPCTRV